MIVNEIVQVDKLIIFLLITRIDFFKYRQINTLSRLYVNVDILINI